MMIKEENYVNQIAAELAVLQLFGLPQYSEGNQLTPYGIHAILHGTSGVPQSAMAGDLLVYCEVRSPSICRKGETPGVYIHRIEQLVEDGSFTAVEKPGRMDKSEIQARVAEFLAGRSTKC